MGGEEAAELNLSHKQTQTHTYIDNSYSCDKRRLNEQLLNNKEERDEQRRLGLRNPLHPLGGSAQGL